MKSKEEAHFGILLFCLVSGEAAGSSSGRLSCFLCYGQSCVLFLWNWEVEDSIGLYISGLAFSH